MKKITALSALFLSTSIALAGGPDQCGCTEYNYPTLNRHKGIYIEGNLGTNIAWESLDILGIKLNDTEVGGFGFNANLGYLFNPYVGVEFGGTAYVPNISTLPTMNSLDAALKGILPIGNRFSLFLKAGGMAYFLEQNDVGVGVLAYYMGAGFGVAITKNFTFNVQMQGGLVPKWGNKVSVSLLSAGLTYYFNH